LAHLPTDHSDVPIRLFKSDFMEFFTHISPITITVIYLPVAVYFMVRGVIDRPDPVSPLYLLAGLVLGIFLWTITEYTLHRWLFHFEPRNAAQEKIIFLFHGIHHAQPQCKTRLVMPPVVSIPLGLIFIGLFQFIFGSVLGIPYWVNPTLSGFTVGYLIYDLTHYATHHFPMRSGWAKYVKRYHMQHHYKTPNARYGVSSPLWDVVFHTKPAD
jgi:sterol desaturase/sphingolipid hydroxylase (fatty acid hydroxylase superfamily)